MTRKYSKEIGTREKQNKGGERGIFMLAKKQLQKSPSLSHQRERWKRTQGPGTLGCQQRALDNKANVSQHSMS